jgi:hypothetical protein
MQLATFNRFELELTMEDALSVSHSGPCDEDVDALMRKQYIIDQFNNIDPSKIRQELREYGAWDDAELEDDETNRRRALWTAGCNIREEND